ncbi:MAG: T9SS type A sorting domain-containing protein [Chitinophagales bacterium]
MKTLKIYLGKIPMLFAAILFASTSAMGASFTAVSSGSFSNSATWGGSAPPSTITADQVTIPSGITVDLDNDLMLNAAIASLDVNGTLNTSTSAALTINSGSLSGTGDIVLDSVSTGLSAVLLFTGSITTNAMTNASASLQVASELDVEETLTLMAGSAISLNSGGDLMIGNNATVIIDSGGGLSVSGGALGFSGNYNVVYSGGSANAGLELSGAGLTDIGIDVGSGNSVSLSSDLMVDGELMLASGTLDIGNNTLTFNSSGDLSASGSGSISSAGAANIVVNSNAGLSGSLSFDASGNTVNNFTVSIGSGSSVQVDSDLNVNGTLQLDGGTTFDFSGAALTINGDLSGSGMLSANASSDLTINVTGGISDSLSFSSNGQVVNNLTINVGSGNSVDLAAATDLSVEGTLDLSGGSSLNIAGSDLNLNGDLNGSGSISANASSAININATGGLSSDLSFSGGSATVGGFSVNVGSGNNVTIDGNLNVTSTLSILSGNLDLNSNDLSVSGAINVNADGAIHSNADSDISIDLATASGASIGFTANGNTVGNFDLNIDSGDAIALGSDLNIDGELSFSGMGSIDIQNNNLQFGASGSISGAGSSSYVITSGSGQVAMDLSAGSGASVEFPVGTSVNFAPANIELNSGSQSGTVMVNVDAGVLANGSSGANMSGFQSVVDATWNVESNINANIDMNMEVLWSTDMEVNGFNNGEAYISHYINGEWDATASASATAEGSGMFSLQREGITSLSPFAVFDENTAVGIPENDAAVEINIFPNPTSDIVVIENKQMLDQRLNAQIISVTGQVIDNYEINGQQQTISLEHLSSGSYFIRIYNDDMNYVEQIQKL